MNERTAELVIIGGGVVGAASAFFAARAGFKIIVLEKRNALGAQTTAASLSAFRAQFADAHNIATMLESISFFENIRERTGIEDADIGLVQQGYLFLTTREDGYTHLQARVELQHALGLTDVKIWSGDETRAHFPLVGENVTAATFRGRDGWLSAHELTYTYARASTRSEPGAEFWLETTADQILIEGSTVCGVRTGRGTIHSPRVLVAAGPFSKRIGEELGVGLPLRLVRRQRTAIKEHALIPPDAPMTVDNDTGAHWRPDGHGAVLGWALPAEPGEPTEDVQPDWDFPARVLDGVARVTPFWNRIAENLRRADIDVRAGQYDMTPDAKPIIGEHPELRGLYFNTGYSGHGVMASPAGARVLADLLTGKLREAENPFSVARFENLAVGEAEHMVL